MSAIAEKTPALAPSLGVRLFDLTERAFLLALAAMAFARLTPAAAREPQVWLILISEGLATAFILMRRRAVAADLSPYAAAVAFAGTAAPLLVVAPGGGVIPAEAGLWVMMAGLAFNISAKAALNRSFGLTAANRGVKRAGPYRLLRHPMYAGYVVTQATFLLLNPCLWNLSVYLIGWSMQLLRIQAEERVLLQDPAYQAYARQVRYRLVPGLY